MQLEQTLQILLLRIRSLIRARQLDAELQEELQFHIDQKARQLVATGLASTVPCNAAMAASRGASVPIVVGAVAPFDRRDLVEAHGDASRERSPLSPRRLSRG